MGHVEHPEERGLQQPGCRRTEAELGRMVGNVREGKEWGGGGLHGRI